MAVRRKPNPQKLKLDRSLPKHLQLRHAWLVALVKRADAHVRADGHGKPTPGRRLERHAGKNLFDTFTDAIVCQNTADGINEVTKYLVDNWADIPVPKRDELVENVSHAAGQYLAYCI